MAANRLSVFSRFRKTRVYTPGAVYKPLPKRLNWVEIEARKRQEGKKVVKGTTKKVIVVRSPDPKIFEQAIFIVRGDFLNSGSSAESVLKEAEKVANDYIKESVGQQKGFAEKIPAPLFAVLGAIFIVFVWFGLKMLGVNI